MTSLANLPGGAGVTPAVARLRLTGTQNDNGGAEISPTWNATDKLSGGFTKSGNALVFPRAGAYLVGGWIGWQYGGVEWTGRCHFKLRHNTNVKASEERNNAVYYDTALSGQTIVNVASGDTLDITGYQTSGSIQTINGAALYAVALPAGGITNLDPNTDFNVSSTALLNTSVPSNVVTNLQMFEMVEGIDNTFSTPDYTRVYFRRAGVYIVTCNVVWPPMSSQAGTFFHVNARDVRITHSSGAILAKNIGYGNVIDSAGQYNPGTFATENGCSALVLSDGADSVQIQALHTDIDWNNGSSISYSATGRVGATWFGPVPA